MSNTSITNVGLDISASRTHELTTAIKAVRQASTICRSVQKCITPETLQKKDRSPVTVADYASQAVIARFLAESLPLDPLVAEEGAALLRSNEQVQFLQHVCEELEATAVGGSPEQVIEWIDRGSAEPCSRFWTLDPIDGTKGFLRKGQYAISLALVIDGAVELAVLGLPNFDNERVTNAGDDNIQSTSGLILFAVKGAGARSIPIDEPLENIAPQRLHVTTTTQTTKARWTESVESGHSAHGVSAAIADRLGIVREPVRMDSQAKYGAVAMGLADAYLRMPTRADYREKIWDHAGGLLVVAEAGGQVTDIDGKPLDFTHGRELAANRGVVASNGTLHQEILRAITETLAVQNDESSVTNDAA